MKTLVSIVILILALFCHAQVSAALQLPDYAQGSTDLKQGITTKGKTATDIISLIVAILSIIGIFIGAGHLAVAKPAQGKLWIFGGIAGLIVAGLAYAIAAAAA